MLPFKVANRAVAVEIPGVEGKVWLRPWSLGFFEKEIVSILDRIAENREGEALPALRFAIASVVCLGENGELAFVRQPVDDQGKAVGAPVPDPDHQALADLPISIAGAIFRAAVSRCGPRESETEKNDSTPSPASA